ncbi:hypothetical protein R3P38DRAFT_3524192 [Favolaschia claudopus]|uniref:Uncharacterized protein n=1 Tax=Favolaschia claudopus TaxID=2862362 RepID=A0AAW0E5B2_9AGAR
MADSPCFPPELERYIFETTAHLYPGIIPRLLLVAQRVLTWIERWLHRTVLFHGLTTKSGHGAAILRALQTHSKPTQFFAAVVRYLFVFSYELDGFFGQYTQREWSDAELELVFQACSGVETLALFGDIEKPKLLELLTKTTMRPWRIIMLLDLIGTTPDLSLSVFDNVTHLFLGDVNETNRILDENWGQLRNLQGLPRLTHLALYKCSTWSSTRWVSALLFGCANLHCLIIVTHDPVPVLEEMNDSRLSIVIDRRPLFDAPDEADGWAHIDGAIRRYTDIFRQDS